MLDKHEIFLRATTAHAQLHPNEMEALYGLAVHYITRGGIAIEIGSFCGGSAKLLGGICLDKGARLYCVDPFSDKPELFNDTVKSRLLDFIDNVQGLPVSILSGNSRWVHEIIRDGCADLVFIDGDHSYDGAKADIINFGRKLSPEGVICGHDYSVHYPGVIRAADELLGRNNLCVVGDFFGCADWRMLLRL